MLHKSEFIKNIITLFSWSTIAQVIAFAAEPILSRLYDPEEFGILALYVSIASIFAIISTGRYELAVMLPKKDRESVNIIGISLIITLITTILTFVLILSFNKHICNWVNNQNILPYLYFVPLTVLLTGIYQTFNYWATRKKAFTHVALSRISQSSSNAIIAIILGIQKLSSTGLVIAYLTGQVFMNIPVLFRFIKYDKKLIKHISKQKMRKMGKTYSDFPKINTLHAFSDMLQFSFVIFLISYFFNEATLGYYSKTFRILTLPASFIGSAVSQVFYQKASNVYNQNGDLKDLVKKTMFGLSLLAFPIFAAIFLWGDDIFAFVLGDIWRTSGEFAQILSIWMYFKFIVSPVSNIPIILNKQKKMFYISMIGNAIIVISIIFGGFMQNIIAGFYLLVSTQIVYFFFFILWIIRISDIKKHPTV